MAGKTLDPSFTTNGKARTRREKVGGDERAGNPWQGKKRGWSIWGSCDIGAFDWPRRKRRSRGRLARKTAVKISWLVFPTSVSGTQMRASGEMSMRARGKPRPILPILSRSAREGVAAVYWFGLTLRYSLVTFSGVELPLASSI